MSRTIELIDRMTPTRRPAGRPSGYHRWSNLLFVHWRVPAEVIRPLLPTGLTLDMWDGDAWVGLVPFHMSGVRPWWSPAVRGLSDFHETNVRTYVHCGGEPGVWFFSLEASNRIAVWLARWGWHLAYHYARMSLERSESRVKYFSRRGTASDVGCNVEVEIASGLPSCAEPGTLEHFLIERYILYSAAPGGRLFRGCVHHAPYSLREARVVSCEETLISSNGIIRSGPPCHVVFCDGVDVEVFPLKPIWLAATR